MTRSLLSARAGLPGSLGDLVQELWRARCRDGGFTLDHRSGELLRSGVVVGAERATALSFPFADRLDERVESWLEQSRVRLSAGDVHLGGWHDRRRGEVWLDLVHVFPPGRHDRAAAIGTTNHQRAIFDLGAGREIWLDAPGCSR